MVWEPVFEESIPYFGLSNNKDYTVRNAANKLRLVGCGIFS